jgi:hypothetical protein
VPLKDTPKINVSISSDVPWFDHGVLTSYTAHLQVVYNVDYKSAR